MKLLFYYYYMFIINEQFNSFGIIKLSGQPSAENYLSDDDIISRSQSWLQIEATTFLMNWS